MNRILVFLILFSFSCSTGKLKIVTHLPILLKEVSGVQTINNSDLLWLLNDSGNLNKIYGITSNGKIEKEVVINAKNNDWEDLTSDELGNLYIGDFGNNHNNRKNLSIFKINNEALKENKNVEVEHISFYFPEQLKFPPKKHHLYFDTESFFYLNDSLYLFTRSRVKGNYGKTSLYKIPAKKGNYAAEFISDYTFCNNLNCAITSAAISQDNKKVVLLSHDTVIILSGYENDNFFSGKVLEFNLKHKSQKEGVCFKDENTLYIVDERSKGKGGNLYELKIE